MKRYEQTEEYASMLQQCMRCNCIFWQVSFQYSDTVTRLEEIEIAKGILKGNDMKYCYSVLQVYQHVYTVYIP